MFMAVATGEFSSKEAGDSNSPLSLLATFLGNAVWLGVGVMVGRGREPHVPSWRADFMGRSLGVQGEWEDGSVF